MRQAGRYLPEYRKIRAGAGSFLDLCFNSELAAEVTLQPIRRFNMDAAILFSDILVIPHALGREVRFLEGEGPKLSPITTLPEVEAMDVMAVEEKLAPVFETLRILSRKLPKDKALIGFAGSPWTVACYMVEGGGSREFAKVRNMALREPAMFQKLIDRITDATIVYLRRQIKCGAHVLQLFDSWAGVLPEQDFVRWSIAPTARIVCELRASHPQIPLIGFPRMAGAMAERYAVETGVNGISIDYMQTLEYARDVLQKRVVVQGNLDPLLLASDKEATLAEAKRIVAQLGEKPFVFNLGHGIVPHTPVEHVQALSEYLLSSA